MATPEPPEYCTPEDEWHNVEKVAISLLLLCDPPQTWEDAALCDRLDYLEARCIGTNAYRKTLQEGTD